MYKRIALNGLAIVSLGFGASAHADFTPGFYAGASLGQGSIDVSGIDGSDTALKVFGGYMFNRHFGVAGDRSRLRRIVTDRSARNDVE